MAQPQAGKDGVEKVKCPNCHRQNVYIRGTRGNDTDTVSRRRFCADCHLSFWTYETPYPDLKKPKIR